MAKTFTIEVSDEFAIKFEEILNQINQEQGANYTSQQYIRKVIKEIIVGRLLENKVRDFRANGQKELEKLLYQKEVN